ncbi:ribonucleoside-diphosphate reductase subunit alpha [Halosquirtibacter laminarini]|uniref:Ribonucleoside-diphosphate reductase subunit alpha n=1 Tax=Halosquirtibacter laminarini TaxID=3374600 RepID=A0AC61NJC4_9BACT|nr:ribonucleoside-diphosphate reductase subunit alpha [Prolixibacteraceae bacterium]
MQRKIVCYSGEVKDYDWSLWQELLCFYGEDRDLFLNHIKVEFEKLLYDMISEKEALDILIGVIASNIDREHASYQFLAAKLFMHKLELEVNPLGECRELRAVYLQNVAIGVYDDALIHRYDEASWELFNGSLKSSYNDLFTYSGLRQMVDKYLVQDRMNGAIFEFPQEAFMLLGMFMFQDEPLEKRDDLVLSLYHAIATFKISLPTPILSGVRTPLKQFSSCCLIDINDTTNSILSSNSAIGYYTAQRAGIGLNLGRIRGKGAKIKNGSVIHTGLVPFMKIFEATTKSFTQNSIRGGGATATIPFFHWEIEQFIRLKNNKGNEENRVRRMDLSIGFHRLFRERVRENRSITLFSMEECPDLYESMYGKDLGHFTSLYERYETREDVRRRQVSARDLYLSILQERFETGRVYIFNTDHVNTNSAFASPIYMSNLCQEITLPTKPIEHVEDEDGEVAMCILSNINLGKIDSIEELDNLTMLLVRFLDRLIDYQTYPLTSAERSTHSRRSLGIGVSDLFHFLARHGVHYHSIKGRNMIHRYMERFQYGLIKASVEIAKERGCCSAFDQTTYAQGILPIDRYCDAVDTLHEMNLECHWDSLRQDILKYGMRNSTLSAIPPAASSSIVSNSTAGVDPPRVAATTKLSKHGPLVQLLPDIDKLSSSYDFAWQLSNRDYIQMVAVVQKFIDQSISTNLYYDLSQCEGERVSMKQLVEDELAAYHYGIKTLYYLNTHDGSGKESEEEQNSCDSGACAV